jgi:protein-S-isoprenylcysteine O-methyltransferase
MTQLFEIVCVVWVGSEIALIIFRRSKQEHQNRDSGSIVWLNLIIYGSLSLAIAIQVEGIGHLRHYFILFPRIGLFLIIIGLVIRWTAILTLRKYFTVNVAIQSGQQVVKSGLFRFLRHPSYLGSILSFVGLALTFANWISLSVILVPITLAFVKRIQIEEQALTEAFGSEYEEYCRSTWRLFPWIY